MGINEKVKDLISRDKIKESIDFLIAQDMDSKKQNNIVLLSGRLNSLENKRLKGIISNQDYELEKNIIRNDLLLISENKVADIKTSKTKSSYEEFNPIRILELYFGIFISTLINPKVLEFENGLSINTNGEGQESVYGTHPTQISWKYLGYFFLAIFLGIYIQKNIPTSTPIEFEEEGMVFIYNFFGWLFYALLLWGIMKFLFGEKYIFKEFFLINFHLLSTLYFVCNFLAYIIVLILDSLSLIEGPHQAYEIPIFTYYLIHFLLLCFYIPISLKKINRIPNMVNQKIIFYVLFTLITASLSYFGYLMHYVTHFAGFG